MGGAHEESRWAPILMDDNTIATSLYGVHLMDQIHVGQRKGHIAHSLGCYFERTTEVEIPLS